MIKQIAKLNYLHIAPRKVRLIANTIKGLPVNEAEAQLYLRPQRSSKPLLKLLRSAIANAKNNQKADPDKLVVDSIWVDQGPVFKRFLPRAMGRATPILKKTSHITLILKESAKQRAPRFNVVLEQPKAKKEKRVKKSTAPKAGASQDVSRPKERVGFLKKIFQRKSV